MKVPSIKQLARAVCGSVVLFALPLFATAAPDLLQEPSRPEIRQRSAILVSEDGRAVPHVEPFIAAHPRDAQVLVGAAVTFESERPSVVSFRSVDGGRSWSATPLPDCRIDPWVAFAPDGTALLSCLAQGGAPTLVFRSSDNGETWSGPSSAPLGDSGPPDRPVLTVGPAGDSAEAFVVYLAQGQSHRHRPRPSGRSSAEGRSRF